MSPDSQQAKMALLVIDVQKGLFEKSTSIYHAQQLLTNINALIDQARQAGAPVIYIQHANPKSLASGSDAWQLHPEIQPRADELILEKHHGNAFEDTPLREELEKRQVGQLVITGLVTHGCVKATCLGAVDEGYRVVLVGDGHSSYSGDAPDLIEKWNRALGQSGAQVIDTQKVSFTRN